MKETIQLCKIISPLPYYSFHETPGDIVHTLLTAFPLLLFLCYPFPSLRYSSPGGNTQKSYICKGCQSWLLDNCQRARGPSPAFQVVWFKLFPRGTDPPGSALVFHSQELHCSGNTRAARSPFSLQLPSHQQVEPRSLTLGYIQVPSNILILQP